MLNFASDKVVVEVGDAKFVAFDDILDNVDSVKGDRLVFNVVFDEIVVGFVEVVEVLVDVNLVVKASSYNVKYAIMNWSCMYVN